MKYIWILPVLLLPVVSSSQSIEGSADYDVSTILFNNPSPVLLREMSAEGYGTKGSRYVFKEFSKGSLFFSNQTRVDGVLLNYDCHNDQLEYAKDESVYLLNSRDIDYFQIGSEDKVYWLFEQVFVERHKKRLFLEVLINLKTILYKRHFREFKEADFTRPYSQERRYDEYLDRHEYYIKTPDADVTLLKPRKRSILKILNNRSEELEEFIKQEKINFKSDADMIRLVRYYDSLTE